MTFQQSLAYYERMLSQSQPAYLSQLRVSQSLSKGGTDTAILSLTTVSMVVLCIQLVLGESGWLCCYCICSCWRKGYSLSTFCRSLETTGMAISTTYLLLSLAVQFLSDLVSLRWSAIGNIELKRSSRVAAACDADRRRLHSS